MKRLLITGFDPFGDNAVNPSWLAVEQLPEQVGEFALRKIMLPTVFGEATRTVLEEAAAWEPDVILCIGLAAGRSAVTPERIGVNIRDARIADNAGNQPVGAFVVPGGPAAYFATVPVEKMAQSIRDTGVAGAVSNTAGTFVCNDTLYALLHHYDGTATRVGFIHIPALPEQSPVGLPLAQIVTALTAAIRACEA